MRLINADALIAYCDERGIPINVDAINAQPLQPEIIRCKDCKHRILNKNYGKKGNYCLKAICELDTGDLFELGRMAENDNWYCADAERREEK